MEEFKACSKCGCQKPLGEFYPKQCWCKQCRREYSRKWNTEHPEQCCESSCKWRKKHPEKSRELIHKSNIKWKAEHPKYMREYFQTSKGKINKANIRHNRRARTKGNKITLTEWMAIKKQQKYRCYWCHKKKKLTMDHVIPLNKGGLHEASNIVAACVPCNSKKNTQIWSLV